MNNTQFLNRLGSEGQVVVASYQKFKSNFEDMKSKSNETNAFNEGQWEKFNNHLAALESAVTDLKRSIDISNDQRFHRRY